MSLPNQYKPVPVTQPTIAYPFKLVHVKTIDMGSSAAIVNTELAKTPIAAIILQMDMLGAGGAAVIASALTQLGTYIKVTDGGDDMTPSWTAAQWYEYLSAFYGRIPPFQDGTAADNKLALLQMVIPFGLPHARSDPSLFSMFDQQVGLMPKGTPQLEISYPADANSIDNRHLKIGAVYMSQKPIYTKKWTSFSSQTLNTTGGIDWILPNTGLLAEAFLYQTSSYNDTLTSDAPTLKTWNLTQAGHSMVTDGQMFNMFGALQDVTPQPDDDYLYVPFTKYPVEDYSLMPKLGNDVRFTAYGGVADALSAAFAVLHPA